MIVILDQNTGEHTAAYPESAIRRIHPFTAMKEDIEQDPADDLLTITVLKKSYFIHIELTNDAKHIIPCRDEAHQKTMFTTLTGGLTTLIIPAITEPKNVQPELTTPAERYNRPARANQLGSVDEAVGGNTPQPSSNSQACGNAVSDNSSQSGDAETVIGEYNESDKAGGRLEDSSGEVRSQGT